MHKIGEAFAKPRKNSGRHYRHNAIFIRDAAPFCTPMDRNAKAKLLRSVEIMERVTKRKGCRNGVVSIPALIVLRTLLLQFHGRRGLCCPSYTTLMRSTGLCRQSIASALRRLRTVGVLKVTARLVRVGQSFGQASNLYGFSFLPPLVYLPERRSTHQDNHRLQIGEVPLHPALRARLMRAVGFQ